MPDTLDLDQLEALARAVVDADLAYEANPLQGGAALALAAAQDAFSVAFDANVVLALLSRLTEAERDTARLDWLDKQCSPLTQDNPDSPSGQTHIGNAWGVYGQHMGVRSAIDEEIETAERRATEATANVDIF